MENLERIVHPLDKLLSKDNWDPAVRKYHSIEEALQHAGTGSLAFDAFQLDALTNGCPLSTLAMYLFSENRLIEDLGLDEVKTQNFFVRYEVSFTGLCLPILLDLHDALPCSSSCLYSSFRQQIDPPWHALLTTLSIPSVYANIHPVSSPHLGFQGFLGSSLPDL